MSLYRFVGILLVVSLSGCGGIIGTSTPPAFEPPRYTVAELLSGDVDGYARALEPRTFAFPHDHGAQPEYAAEWWYYTGNVTDAHGHRFGFLLVFFRFGLTPDPVERESDWAASSSYMAHLAVTDVANNQYYSFERFSRGAAGLAGALGEPTYTVWLDDWRVTGENEGLPMRLRAAQAGIAIDLLLDTTRPMVFHGDQGLSQKGNAPGSASHYYAYTRLATTGTITIDDESYAVQGTSWFDREIGTRSLEAGVVGWDWFALQLDDGRDLMYYRLRDADGATTFDFGALIDADGAYTYLTSDELTLRELATWTSPHTGAMYPHQWQLQVPTHAIDVVVQPVITDQELVHALAYYEGAVDVYGANTARIGWGYVELAGYADIVRDLP
ncbi:MAG: carotenoid 1,2-hydratase [Blastochloris sp.]|nr:carotenoid 1,2-hydratase [Blastochloris sp.]